jgi:NAD(P)-dependent dehydrogenase (short-subunit alcohol dehydrogenase family)
MTERLHNKVIVVAGAGGIGSGIAYRLASEGASVVLGDINLDAAENTVAEIAAGGGSAIATQLDGADDASCKALIELAVLRFGGLDGIHINFTDLRDGGNAVDVLDLDLDDFDATIRVNVRGFLLCTRHAIPAILARGGGSIVYTASNAAYMGEPVRVAYAMSKGAVLPLMRHVASRFGPQGLRANAIAPGVIMHPRLASMMPEEAGAAFREQTKLKTLGEPKDIAAVSALLMSEDGKFITGQVIAVDGGGFMRP